jgi:hypothetical protein
VLFVPAGLIGVAIGHWLDKLDDSDK